jgi:CubicO group peptidase (beta-lactamase class C family)
MKNKFVFTLLILSVAFTKAQVNTTDSSMYFIQRKIDSVFEKNALPGLFVSVINNGQQHYFSKGYANPDTKLLFDSATFFEIGSITKTFTAFVLQKILDENKIADTASIIQYLPDSVQTNTALQKISFLSLMNHTSGLPRLPGNMEVKLDNKAPYDNYTAAQLFSWLKTCSPAPDGKSNYSNLGAGLAGVLAELIAGKSYTRLLEENIFRPFKMIGGTDVFSKEENKSQGFFNDQKTAYWNMDVLAPAGGIKCSSKEMLRYLQFMSKPEDAVNKKIIDELLQPTVAINKSMNVCKAWHTFELPGKPTIYWHNGGTFGFSTFAAFIKGGDKAVMVVINKFSENKVADGLGVSIMKGLIQ